MEARDLAIYLSGLKTYPIKLARKIGVERAVLWYELFIKYGSLAFPYEDQSLIGILQADIIYEELCTTKFLIKEDGLYRINFNKIIEIAEHLPDSRTTQSPFKDFEFTTLVGNYVRMMARLGREIKLKNIYILMEGKTLEQCKKALLLSTQNGFSTLYFDDKYKGVSGTGKVSGRIGDSGGSTNSHKAGYKGTEI